MSKKSEIRLGQYLIKQRLCALRDISSALEEQARLRRQGEALPLGRILVQRGALADLQLQQALADLGVLVLECPSCSLRFRVERLPPDTTLRCQFCSSELVASGAPCNGDELPYEEGKKASVGPALGEQVLSTTSVDATARLSLRRDSIEGRVLGGYRIERKLASGGMGVVYEARQLNLDRRVALKVLGQSFSEDQSFVRRFLEEARSAARLNHSNIVSIIDVGECDGTYYFTMEFIDGVTLKSILADEGKLSIPRSIELAIQVSAALQHAHHRKIIHRDIKPENIMLTQDGQVKLADLGLAKQMAEGAESLTQTGSILGTPLYMAPEQARDFSSVDERSDIYSLGVTLYRMTSGHPPFKGRTPIEVMMNVMAGKRPPLRLLLPDVDPRFESLVDQMMLLEPAERYQTIDEVLLELRRLALQLEAKPRQAETEPS